MINNKTFWIIISIGLIILIALMILSQKELNESPESKLSHYKEQVINITNDYLDTKISKEEALEKLELTNKQVELCSKENNDNPELLSLSIYIDSLENSIIRDDMKTIKDTYNKLKE